MVPPSSLRPIPVANDEPGDTFVASRLMARADSAAFDAINRIKSAIACFQREREAMLERRHRALDSVMVLIDEELMTNARVLKALNRTLELAEDHLRRREKETHQGEYP